MRGLYVATSKSAFRYGDRVIVRTDRGMEAGDVLCEATDQALAHMEEPQKAQILRRMSGEDADQIDRIGGTLSDEMKTCQSHIDRLGLEMQLVDVEHIFGGERIVVYYLAEKRVDFRQLVRDLASEFQTRVEMRQIGVRDEAKLLADYGDCGKPVCCNSHLSKMPPVSMRMAKLQKATLDPTKISGRCGRLKCCLRYEFDTYEEMQREMPPPGAMVLTRDGKAKVIHQEILSQQLLVQTEDNRRVLIDVSDVLTVVKNSDADQNRSRPKKKNKRSGGNSKNDISEQDDNKT